MTGRVEEDAHARLRLVFDQDGSGGESVVDGSFEILDLDVEVELLVLASATAPSVPTPSWRRRPKVGGPAPDQALCAFGI